MRANRIDERIKNGNKLSPEKVFCPIIFIVQISTPKDKNKRKSNIKAL